MSSQDETLIRQFRRVLALAIGVLVLGTVGYMLIEGLSLLDALYMTVITLGTVGYREVGPVHPLGQVFTIILILIGVGGLAYTGATVVQYVVEGRVGGVLHRRKVRTMIDKLQNHVILCGYGRVGQAVAHELRQQGVPCVVVDARADRIDQAGSDGFAAFCGDASADNTLRIVARAGDRNAEAKLLRVGANRVLSPYTLAGRHLALLSVRSAVVDFVSSVISGINGGTDDQATGHDLRLENIAVSAQGWIHGHTPAEVRARLREGATLLAITTPAGEIITDLGRAGAPLQPGDLLILIGTPAQLKQVEQLA